MKEMLRNGQRSYANQIRDYAYFSRKAFSYKNIVSDLGLLERGVQRAMKSLRDAGEIVLISKPQHGMYLHRDHATTGQAQQPRQYDWVPDRAKLGQILISITYLGGCTHAEVAKASGIRYETVGRYLEALAYMSILRVKFASGRPIYYWTATPLPDAIPDSSKFRGFIKQLREADHAKRI
jgi:CRP-like cAMP-binding protein